MQCNSHPNILILFFLIKAIVSSPVTDSSTTTDSYPSNEVSNLNQKPIDGQQSVTSELADEATIRKPLFPIQKPQVLPAEVISTSGENVFESWKPQRDHSVTSADDVEPSISSQIHFTMGEGGLDNHTETKNPGGRKRFRGIPRSIGGSNPTGQQDINNGTNEDGGAGDGGIGSIDPCPVLTFLCFQDREYCPPMEYFCPPTSQEVRVKRSVQCILSWISGQGGTNCSSIFG